MEIGIMFFASSKGTTDKQFSNLLKIAKKADRGNLSSIWTPERHFHAFGSGFPNPSVLGAALAVATERIGIRAGSVISPLHREIRIAEEWSVVDNLSNGRVGISFGSGWNANDFVLAPEAYHRRREIMFGQIETVRKLWQGGTLTRLNGVGKATPIELYPKPCQHELPVWITSSGNPETFVRAGQMGTHVLTHLMLSNPDLLKERIEQYRTHFRHPDKKGKVTLMLHTFIAPTESEVREVVSGPFREYLKSSIGLEKMAAAAGGAVSGNLNMSAEPIPEELMDELTTLTFERYLNTMSLMGTPEEVMKRLHQFKRYGVDEVACLIDFGVDEQNMMKSMDRLIELNRNHIP